MEAALAQLVAALPPSTVEQMRALADALLAAYAAQPFATGLAAGVALLLLARAVAGALAPRFNAAVADVGAKSSSYTDLHDDTGKDQTGARKARAQEMVNYYYDLATDMYLWGWGESFHFAHRFRTETLRESILRHEYYLAAQLGLQPGQTCMDLGCGVGGPARNIARFSGAKVGRGRWGAGGLAEELAGLAVQASSVPLPLPLLLRRTPARDSEALPTRRRLSLPPPTHPPRRSRGSTTTPTRSSAPPSRPRTRA